MTSRTNRLEGDKPVTDMQQDQALDSLGIVVGEIAHDFNNILSLIFGYVEMALSEIPEGERARSDLEHVLAAGDRAKELVSRILTYSNRAKLKKERIDVIKPVTRALKYVADRIPPGVELQSNIGAESCFMMGNDTELFQIITNLCNNSLQAMPQNGGKIEVNLQTITKDSDFLRDHPAMPKLAYALLTVKDNGAGMELSTLEKIYTPFFTTARAEDKSGLRAGLGLTTVYNIVTSQDGFIFVNSAPGEGTTFEICLPVMTENTQVPQQTVSKPRKTSEKRVLFVDDEPAITEMAGHILAHSGYRAMFFIDGNEALEYFRAHPYDFDIIITDLKMPRISGSELASRCAEINPNIPIILTTGFSEKISLASCRQWGVTTVITKPFSIGQLLANLEELTK
jgi:CheY-like chemotaxis protein/nitrogen-specific signal transduction histidine kinase